MDVMRSCSVQRVYWDNARTKSSLIRWYFVPDDTPFLPGWNRFCSEIWDPVHWYCEGAGLDYLDKPVYRNGKPLGPFTAKKPCGKLEWFDKGCPSDAPPIPRRPDGLPACCFGRGAYSPAYSDDFDTFSGK